MGIANEDETKLSLTGYVRVTNGSGEQYDNAQTRLVVGKINLVEKIADLARRPPPIGYRRRPPEDQGRIREELSKSIEKRIDDDSKLLSIEDAVRRGANKAPAVIKQGLSEYFLFTIEGREDIKDKEPKRLVALKAAEVPLESIYKLSDRSGDQGFTKFYRFKNVKLLDDHGKEKKLPSMENLGLSPLPNGTVRLFSEYKNHDLAYVGGTETKYVPIGDRVEVNVGPDKDITIQRRVKDQKIGNVVARQYKRRLDKDFVLYYDLVDYDETFFSGRRWSPASPLRLKSKGSSMRTSFYGAKARSPRAGRATKPGRMSIFTRAGHVERVDQQHVKYFLDLKPGKKQAVAYSVTYKRRKVGPELNTEKKREPLPIAKDPTQFSPQQIEELVKHIQASRGSYFVVGLPKRADWPPDGLTGEITSIKDNAVDVSVGMDDGISPGTVCESCEIAGNSQRSR